VDELHMSEDTAYKRIQAARAARDFPEILDRLEDGRLHLTAVVILKPHLTRENAAELLDAGSHRTKSELEHVLAACVPEGRRADGVGGCAGAARCRVRESRCCPRAKRVARGRSRDFTDP
jgi:hypothetical protein